MGEVSCRDTQRGTILAQGVRSPSEGVEISTTAIGTPNNFYGYSTLKRMGELPVITSVDSANLGDDTIAGEAAEIGRQNLKNCFSRMSPSL